MLFILKVCRIVKKIIEKKRNINKTTNDSDLIFRFIKIQIDPSPILKQMW